MFPLEARLSQQLIRALAERSPQTSIPEGCQILDVTYSGDEGGIMCRLDIGAADAKNAHHVSITHLEFQRKVPLFRDIENYRRHRIKKLKQSI